MNGPTDHLAAVVPLRSGGSEQSLLIALGRRAGQAAQAGDVDEVRRLGMLIAELCRGREVAS